MCIHPSPYGLGQRQYAQGNATCAECKAIGAQIAQQRAWQKYLHRKGGGVLCVVEAWGEVIESNQQWSTR